MKKMTHIGMQIWRAHNQSLKRELKLRETKNYYIYEYGTKYKKDGSIVGERFSAFKLDISSIKALWKILTRRKLIYEHK